MKVEIPEIFWHGDRDRIMSIDFYPNTNFLVTCGAESEDKMYIKLWQIVYQNNKNATNSQDDSEKGLNSASKDKKYSTEKQLLSEYQIIPKFLHELSGAHTTTVNVVRFSPNGMYLATGGDDSAIVIWVQRSRPISFGSSEEKVTWSNYKILRGHLSDVYDLYWSPDSNYLISGSVDNSAIIWSIEKGKSIYKINDHIHFVQGVSWDPRNKYVVTQSSDRTVRFYKIIQLKNNEMKFCYMNQLKKFDLEVEDEGKGNETSVEATGKNKNKVMVIEDEEEIIKNNNNNIKENTTNTNLNNEMIIENNNFGNSQNIEKNENIIKATDNNEKEDEDKKINDLESMEIEINLTQIDDQYKALEELKNKESDKMIIEEENFIQNKEEKLPLEGNNLNPQQNNNISSNSNSNHISQSSNPQNTQPNANMNSQNENISSNTQLKPNKEPKIVKGTKGNKAILKSKTNSYYYFIDESQSPSFVRRHAWSPDGSFCLLVCGSMRTNPKTNEIEYVVWGVTRKNISYPTFYIPTLDKCSICIRFCPIIFKKVENPEETPLIETPYTMVFAIGTADSVYIYSTDSIQPKFAITNIHYLPISDLAWQGDELLAVSSSDGYITFVKFEKHEFGIRLTPEEIEDEKLKASYETYLKADITKCVMNTNYVTANIKPKKKAPPVQDNNIEDKNKGNKDDLKLFGISNLDELPELPRYKLDENQQIVRSLTYDIINNSYGKDSINMSKECHEAFEKLFDFNYENIYLNPKAKPGADKRDNMFGIMYEKYLNDIKDGHLDSSIYNFINTNSKEYRELAKKNCLKYYNFFGPKNDYFYD